MRTKPRGGLRRKGIRETHDKPTVVGHPDGLLWKNPAAGTDHSADGHFFHPGADHRGNRRDGAVCQLQVAAVNRPLLYLGGAGHAAAGTALCNLLRTAQSGPGDGSFPRLVAGLFQQRRGLLRGNHSGGAGISKAACKDVVRAKAFRLTAHIMPHPRLPAATL